MKALIMSVYAYLILLSSGSLFAADPDLEQGIQFYKEKKNYEALGYLEKSLQKEKTGIAFYYLEKKMDTSWTLVPPYKILRNSVQSAPYPRNRSIWIR
ncbi:hypothetical protein [Leptospira wolffii]|uniref:hypothetical protein n=1 Tax=Leptospira wolffii TaxID=409998 RepID=UPI0012EC122C|nr:hypothetical protein [Leptospira wolffii]